MSLLFLRKRVALRAQAAQVPLGSRGRGEREVLACFGALAAFDCRISQFPNAGLVRLLPLAQRRRASQRAERALATGCCEATGSTVTAATQQLEGHVGRREERAALPARHQLQRRPAWQKRGIGLYWELYDKPTVNPLTGEEVFARRRRVKVDYELPMRDQYGDFILRLIEDSIENE